MRTLSMRHLTVLSFAAALLFAACGDDSASSSTGICRGANCGEVRDTGSATDTGAAVDSGAVDTGAAADTEADTVADTTPDTALCAEGAIDCSASGLPETCTGGTWVEGTACQPTEVCRLGRCVPGESCTPGQVRGCVSSTQRNLCNEAGTGFVADDCATGEFCLDGLCGTQQCNPGDTRCDDDFTISTCSTDGTSWNFTETCDRRSLRVCENGECVSGCIAAVKDPSYIGCEYWSVDLPQYHDLTTPHPDEVPHSVVIANVGDFPADIAVISTDRTFIAPAGITVAPRSTGVLTFPVASIADTGITSRSFKVTTTEPVVAYQFSPLNDLGVFSNDASLMLPANALGRRYRVMGLTGGIAALGFPAQRAWFTVVATQPRTNVTVTLSAAADNGGGLTGLTAGVPHTFTLETGQVLNFAFSSVFSFPPVEADPTGSLVEADRPIVVFSGHEEAVIGDESESGNCCADHLQEQLFPVETWRSSFLCIHTPPRGTENDWWRVVADTNGTRITTQPPIAGLDGVTLNAGQFVEVQTALSFELSATAPVLVGQYMVSQQALGVSRYGGDPSLTLMVPSDQFRTDYVIQVPAGYAQDYLTVVKPVGVELRVNGVAVAESEFTPFGTRSWAFAHLNRGEGTYQLSAAQPFGLYGYGYDNAVSYGYPGGLNLTTTP